MTIELDDTAEPFDSLIAGVARMPAYDAGWQPPDELDEYKLVRPLGRGGMGSVWLAHDRLLDRLVAVKFIAAGAPDVEMRARFEIEARAAARLQHLNVVTVHRYGTLDGHPYLVSEYIRGEALDRLAKPVGWERAVELGLALARGLAAAHRAGIVHRDIKPGNAIVTADGDVKLVDFGLARLGAVEPGTAVSSTTSHTSALTAPGAIAGTPRYLAPEVRLGEPATPRSDVYGIGCILYELVTGRAPSVDQNDGVVPAIAEQTNARFAAIVERCLADDPARRFATGEELREALEKLAAPAFGGELPEGNPYRGLVAFEAEHRTLFFGRGAEIRAVIERLRAEAFVLVTGDSGVGKSSLCRAGVLPNVREGAFGDGVAWSAFEIVPGAHPLAALSSAVAPLLGADEAEVATRLANEPGALARELRRALGPGRGVVLFIDQLEELVTLATRADAEAFAAVLGQLATRTPGVRVLATVRSDFLTRLAELPGLGDLARALYVLRPLSAEGAREAIVGPARAKGARFESEALVDALVASVADPGRIELPLLAFTLEQLWEARDPTTHVISQRSLDAIGGVRGALARHADGVLDAMMPGPRAAARTLLLRLVTAERTRARRSASELAAIDASALDALVRARLVIARGGEQPTYELAHERLIDGWPTLVGWLSQSAEAHAAHERLATAAEEWQRQGRPGDALWSERQLAAVALLDDADLTALDRAFVTAARRATRRRRLRARALVIAVPVLIVAAYTGANVVARRALARRVDANVASAEPVLSRARSAAVRAHAAEAAAFAGFDAGDVAHAEPAWADARAAQGDARAAYAEAARALEAAYLLDTQRDDVRTRLAQVTRDRLALATAAERGELEGRLALYDPAATRAGRARVHVTTTPPDASVSLGGQPLPAELAPGSYVIVAQRTGRATVRVPIAIGAGEERTIHVTLPDLGSVPDGFVAIPAGRFLYGAREDEPIRQFFGAPPMHERELPAFLIGRTEVRYRDWIAFLDALPAAERERRRPHQEHPNTVADGGAVELRRREGGWELRITPAGDEYVARAGQPIAYDDRATRASQDWLDFPVAGISPEDAEAYARWLDESGRVPKARLCSEAEWEYAARGVDGRAYPGGDKLGAEDANIDVTYGQLPKAFGPDAVGAHPASTSPFGLVDTAGNVWEITRTRSEYVTRGGCYYTNAVSAHLANRQTIPATYRHVQIGLRLCADAPRAGAVYPPR